MFNNVHCFLFMRNILLCLIYSHNTEYIPIEIAIWLILIYEFLTRKIYFKIPKYK